MYTLVEFIPACWRESHRAARNSGSYPLNGAERVWLEGELDAADLDPDWARIVRTAAALPHGAELVSDLDPDAYRSSQHA